MVQLSVLVIDDNPDHCNLHREMLELDGHHVRTATDCEQALDLLRQHDFHVVLLDLMMPQVEGLELLPRIREIDDDVAVVIVTGHPSYESASASIAHEVAGYVSKPVTIEAFREIALRVIRKKGLDPQGEEILHQVVGNNIRNLRRKADLTLKQLARRTGLSSALLSQIERASSQATVSTLFKVAAALGVNLLDLLAGYDGPGRNS